jgi:hypothetical protein
MDNKHYFFKLTGNDFQLKHENCTSEKHEITHFKILSDYIIHEYNHPRIMLTLKVSYRNETDGTSNLGTINSSDFDKIN